MILQITIDTCKGPIPPRDIKTLKEDVWYINHTSPGNTLWRFVSHIDQKYAKVLSVEEVVGGAPVDLAALRLDAVLVILEQAKPLIDLAIKKSKRGLAI